MGELNVDNRSLFIADNLDVLRGINNSCIDLIAIDPPFNKGQFFAFGGDKTTGFKDHWTWQEDVHEEWLDKIKDDWPGIEAAINAAHTSHSEGLAAYLSYMGIRLIEMHRVLKDTGSLYLHCDDTASHYLKMLLDAIFGNDVFRNEVLWQRFNFHADAKRFGRVSDRLLFYAKTDTYTFNRVRVPFSRDYIESKFRYADPDGRLFSTDNLNPPAGRGPVYEFYGVTKPWRFTEERMLKLDRQGRIYTQSKVPRLKRYLDEMQGQAVHDNWHDIPPINSQAKERTGWPTQKPLALYRRIIEASSDEGDVVLDAFAGCATTAVAAEGLERKWVAIDLEEKAYEVLKSRLAKEGFTVNGEAVGEGNGRLGRDIKLHHAAPTRSPGDVDPIPAARMRKLTLPPARRSTRRASMSRVDMLQALLDNLGFQCWGCGFAPPGMDSRFFELDHREPRSAGGSNELYNRAVLCGPCNARKSDRMNLLQLRRENEREKQLYGELIDLVGATDFCDKYMRESARG